MPIQHVRYRAASVGTGDRIGLGLALEVVGTGLLAVLLSMIQVAIEASRCDAGCSGSRESLTAAVAVSVIAMSGALLALAHGAHLNPLLTLAAWWDRRRFPHDGRIALAYVAAQSAGAFLGVSAIELVIDGRQLPAVDTPATGVLVGTEFASATGLVALFLIFTTARRGSSMAGALGGYLDVITVIGWSYTFANPALIIGTLPHTSLDDSTARTAIVVLTALFGGGFVGAQYFAAQSSGGANTSLRKSMNIYR